MQFGSIVVELKTQREKINRAIEALEDMKPEKRTERHMTAEGRARISRAAKRRWARVKLENRRPTPVKKSA